MNKFLTLAATSLAALQMQVVAQDTRPNIIYIMSDDHALQAISAYGSRLAKVFPNSSKLLLSNKEPLFNATSVGNFLNRPEALGNHSKTVSFHKSSLYLHPLLDSIFMNNE